MCNSFKIVLVCYFFLWFLGTEAVVNMINGRIAIETSDKIFSSTLTDLKIFICISELSCKNILHFSLSLCCSDFKCHIKNLTSKFETNTVAPVLPLLLKLAHFVACILHQLQCSCPWCHACQNDLAAKG